ncbi:hypothetical protein ACFVSW_21510 [Neobacillus sp. NPDC058068]|uniref:hypothetical protein n=1 Tax=Neobacillus sp. NPDC058068 TaxID=3346325 RepID=UPI0036DC24B8
MKKIQFSSLIVLFLFTLLLGNNVSFAQITLPEKPLPCNSDEIEPNNTIDTATSVCSNDEGRIYGDLSPKDVDYFRLNNYFDYSDYTIAFDHPDGARLELLDGSGKQVDGTVTSDFPYGTNYYYHRLEMGSYFIKVYWESKPTSTEALYLLKIKQKVFFTGWQFNSSYWEYWLEGKRTDTTGWVNFKNQWFYVVDGARQENGWIRLGTKWYYLTPNTGVMKTGWLLDKGKWYYLNKTSGAMQTGWIFDGSKWYYTNQDGSMRTGWLLYKNKWYFLQGSGAMATGWILSGGKWYYLYSDGSMAANTYIGKYRVGKDGAWIK